MKFLKFFSMLITIFGARLLCAAQPLETCKNPSFGNVPVLQQDCENKALHAAAKIVVGIGKPEFEAQIKQIGLDIPDFVSNASDSDIESIGKTLDGLKTCAQHAGLLIKRIEEEEKKQRITGNATLQITDVKTKLGRSLDSSEIGLWTIAGSKFSTYFCETWQKNRADAIEELALKTDTANMSVGDFLYEFRHTLAMDRKKIRTKAPLLMIDYIHQYLLSNHHYNYNAAKKLFDLALRDDLYEGKLSSGDRVELLFRQGNAELDRYCQYINNDVRGLLADLLNRINEIDRIFKELGAIPLGLDDGIGKIRQEFGLEINAERIKQRIQCWHVAVDRLREMGLLDAVAVKVQIGIQGDSPKVQIDILEDVQTIKINAMMSRLSYVKSALNQTTQYDGSDTADNMARILVQLGFIGTSEYKKPYKKINKQHDWFDSDNKIMVRIKEDGKYTIELCYLDVYERNGNQVQLKFNGNKPVIFDQENAVIKYNADGKIEYVHPSRCAEEFLKNWYACSKGGIMDGIMKTSHYEKKNVKLGEAIGFLTFLPEYFKEEYDGKGPHILKSEYKDTYIPIKTSSFALPTPCSSNDSSCSSTTTTTSGSAFYSNDADDIALAVGIDESLKLPAYAYDPTKAATAAVSINGSSYI
ncbi:MAG: hypothetical protein NTX76_03230 [Alphaproteobacteria bacterium]|nr:hypothetical protein [Alphaproteobacteria bacterium]